MLSKEAPERKGIFRKLIRTTREVRSCYEIGNRKPTERTQIKIN